MKFKQWLKEYQQMSYADFVLLPDIERWSIEGEFQYFNTKQNRTKQLRVNMIRDGIVIRFMTEEESEQVRIASEKERLRYETNLKIGGIDERGNYTALHHRWEV